MSIPRPTNGGKLVSTPLETGSRSFRLNPAVPFLHREPVSGCNLVAMMESILPVGRHQGGFHCYLMDQGA